MSNSLVDLLRIWWASSTMARYHWRWEFNTELTIDIRATLEPGPRIEPRLRKSQSFALDWVPEPRTGFILLFLDCPLESSVSVLVIDNKSRRMVLAFVSFSLPLCPDLLEIRVVPLRHQRLASKFRVGCKTNGE